MSFFDDLSSGDVERLASVFVWDDECSSEEPGECFGVVWMGEEWEEEGSVGGRWVDSFVCHGVFDGSLGHGSVGFLYVVGHAP